jgi:hypothetical protein
MEDITVSAFEYRVVSSVPDIKPILPTLGRLGFLCAGIFKQSMGARNRVGLGLSYRPSRLHSLAELVPWNQFLGSFKV